MKIDYKYVEILEDILTYGYDYEDPNRKGTFRKELEVVVLKHLREDYLPIVTARKTYFKGAVGELLLFLKGTTDIRDYWDYKIRFWDDDFCRFHNYSKEDLDRLYRNRDKEVSKAMYSMGKIYPHQYAKQYEVFENFKRNPLRTDLIVNSWQVDDLKDMCLVPCHYDFQIVGSPEGFMIVWNQRSTDFLLGTPINVQFYFLMGMLLEVWSGHKFNGVYGILKKVHLYDNQFELAKKITEVSPELYNEDVQTIIEYDYRDRELPFSEFVKKLTPENFQIENYSFVLDEKVPMLTYNKPDNE